MYCPMQLYIKNHIDTSERENYRLAIEIKKLKIDIQDLIQKNMRKIKKDMAIAEIENILSENIDSYIESTADSIKSMDIGLETAQIKEIKDNSYFNIKITSLKIKQVMLTYDKDAYAVMDMFFPNCMYSYLLKDKTLDLIGVCDGNPPLKGVWNQDAIELISYAILLEEEFDTDIFVGFVDYEKIGDRRPVVMDVTIRKEFFNIIREVKEIVENRKLPNVKKSHKKCEICEYKDNCLKN